MKQLQAFLSARFDDDEGFARDLVSPSAVPPAAYAIGVTLAQRILTEVQLGRTIVARCQTTDNEAAELAQLKYDVVRNLAMAYAEHPDFQSTWR